MRTRQTWFWGALSGAALALGCDADPERALPSFGLDVPVALEGALLYLDDSDRTEPQALIVDVSNPSAQVSLHALPEGDAASYPRPGAAGSEVFVLTSGRRAEVIDGKSRDAVNSFLLLFDRDGEQMRKELPGRFTKLSLSDDGRFAIAHDPADGLAFGDAVAVVDLATPEAEARNVRLSGSRGEAVSRFVFSPPESGGPRLLLVPRTDSLDLLDLEQLDRGSLLVPLKLPGDERTLRPDHILFRDKQIFVQISRSSDVLVLQLIPDATRVHGFNVAPLQIATSSNVHDIALVDAGEGLRLVAVGSDRVSLLDPVTGSGVSTQVGSGFSRVLLFEASSPLDDQVRQRALLYAENGLRLGFLDFDDGSAWAQQQLEIVDLSEPFESFLPVPERRMAVLVHPSGRLNLVDLEARTVSPIDTGAQIPHMVLDQHGDEVRLWLSAGDDRVGCVDLVRLSVSEVLLNAGASAILPVEGAQRRIAVIHPSASGYVTLLDPEQPSRESARELVAFLYNKLFD